MQKTDYEEWEEIGERLKQVDRDITALVHVLNSVPKSEWTDQHDRASDAIAQLRDDLEERMAKEHPEKWDTDVFYGTGDLDPSWE